MSDPKCQRIEELEKQLAEQKNINAANLEVIWNWERKASEYRQKIDSLQEQCSIRYEAIERLNGEKKQLEEVIKDRTKDVQHYDEENKRLKENNEILQKAYDEEERSAVEWCNRYNNTETKYRRLTVLIGEFVRQAVEL